MNPNDLNFSYNGIRDEDLSVQKSSQPPEDKDPFKIEESTRLLVKSNQRVNINIDNYSSIQAMKDESAGTTEVRALLLDLNPTYQKAKELTYQVLKYELTEFKRAHTYDTTFGDPVYEGDMFKLKGFIMGPPGSPYEGGTFFLNIEFPIGYPKKPLRVKFVTQICHLNVASDGEMHLCHEMHLYPNSKVRFSNYMVLFLMTKLIEPYTACKPCLERMPLYKDNRKLYEETAKEWTVKYAKAEPQPHLLNELSNQAGMDRDTYSSFQDGNEIIEYLEGILKEDKEDIVLPENHSIEKPLHRKRLEKELSDLKTGPISQTYFAKPIDEEDLYKWKGFITGPPGSPYEGGTFFLNIEIPNDYPFIAPKIKFVTHIFHHNISLLSGEFCSCYFISYWHPGNTISKVLTILMGLLKEPHIDCTLVSLVSLNNKLYLKDKTRYEHIARAWTTKYAKSSSNHNEYQS